MTTFYLGTHRPHWLQYPGPWFVSHSTLKGLKSFHRAVSPWALDSSGFTEVSTHGRWTFNAAQYALHVKRYASEIGNLDWAAPQDWMCEPFITAKTGHCVAEHQHFTLYNFIELRERLGSLVIPVLQGWTMGDYLDHVEMYAKAGIDLTKERLVGIGSICRRQATIRASVIFNWLYLDGIPLHAFGLKLGGLEYSHPHIKSADSLAWSFDARRARSLPECSHRNCANCLRYAQEWRRKAERYLPVKRFGRATQCNLTTK